MLITQVRTFYPYESAHAAGAVIRIDDKDNQWYDAIDAALKRYKAHAYQNATPNQFRPEMDNKITIMLEGGIYVTYWDNTVFISARLYSYGNKKLKSCTLIKKDNEKDI
jgi:hypothetical protein